MKLRISFICLRALILIGLAFFSLNQARAQSLPAFDFTQAAQVTQWGSAHDISSVQATAEGMLLTISGADPYLSGPARNFPTGQPLYLRLRLKSDQAGSCQVFYFTTGPSEANSVRFNVPAGVWVEGRVAMPALGTGFRFRIDPPGTGGTATIASLRFEAQSGLPDFDFSTIPDATQWGSPHDLTIQAPTTNGLPLTITGGDPYLYGPARDYPTNQPLWMNLRIKSDTGGNAQLFYFQTGPTEDKSVHFYVPGGDWTDVQVPLPALAPQTRLRIDPPGGSGGVILGRMTFAPRVLLTEPAWPTPSPPVLAADALTVTSGGTTLRHGSAGLGDFEVRVNGTLMAVGNKASQLGYTIGQSQRWLPLNTPATVQMVAGALVVTATATDQDGGVWQFEQKFSLGTAPGSIEVRSTTSVSADRLVAYLPLFTLLPGVGSFGTNKTQGMFAGVEYLENEPSSSEADVIGAGARRKVPDALKVTFPLMALAAAGKYVGLAWEANPAFAALHDSPDRTFNAGGHLMSLLYPGSDPALREDGSILPYGGQLIQAQVPLVARATILGGVGTTVVPAIQQYLVAKPLPPLPTTGYTADEYFKLASHGWLDSQIRDGAKFRHAVGPSFGSMPAADAAMFMSWLSQNVSDTDLASRLSNLTAQAIALVPFASYNSMGVGHVRTPVEALVFGHVADNAVTALNEGRGVLSSFQPDGTVLYVPPATGTDLSRTHWSREANGLAATRVVQVLERAVFSGDSALMQEGLRVLHAMDKFRDTVPRGAQTWEVPLHTPDILASAYLVRAYTLGYELTGDRALLEQARYWAWTGLPFIYLTPPNDKPAGVYSTIPVFGATQFVAPLWIGLPVQWCGLVYGNAVRRFARHDPSGPWIQIADGIARAGLLHTHPGNDPAYQGLLPDSFELRNQVRNPVPINPATLLTEGIEMEGALAFYDFRSLLHHGLRIHSPGPIVNLKETATGISFTANVWPKQASYILLNGFTGQPAVKIDGVAVPLQAPHLFQAVEGRLILQLTKPSQIEVTTPARDALNIRPVANGKLEVSWALPSAAAYSLESAPLPEPVLAWSPSNLPVTDSSSQRTVTFSPSGAGLLFRLTAP